MKKLRAFALALALAIVSSAVATAAWPVQDRYSYVSQGFSDGHRGMDLAADSGKRVAAIGNGKVVFAGWKSNCGGYQVWVRHTDGVTYSAYYHLSKEVTYAGEYVTGESEVIAYVGSTGCASGPHVHTEVWKGFPWRTGSYRVNPYNFIMKGYWLPYRYR